MLNFHWLLESEAVTDERSGSLDAGTLGYSSSGRGSLAADWGWVTLRDAEFLLAQRSSEVTGAAERALNSDWLRGLSYQLIMLLEELPAGVIDQNFNVSIKQFKKFLLDGQ